MRLERRFVLDHYAYPYGVINRTRSNNTNSFPIIDLYIHVYIIYMSVLSSSCRSTCLYKHVAWYMQVTLESLEGKVFSVDASILMNQAIKGMREQPNAHLHVLFLRLCKLLTYKIKPIFVFDGAAPVLKRRTILARQRRREESNTRANGIFVVTPILRLYLL